jgi:hypothetical protein
MTTMSHSTGRSLTSFVLGFTLVVPATASAGQPDASTTTAPAVAPAPQPDPALQPQPAPQPQPDPGLQPQPDPSAGAVPAPVYQPAPAQPGPQPLPNRNRGLGLMISGFSVFSIAYIISAVTGVIMIDTNNEEIGRPLLIPVAGPFIAINRTRTALGGFGLGFVGIVQLAGFGMGVGGAVMFGRARHQAQLSAGPGGLQLRF